MDQQRIQKKIRKAAELNKKKQYLKAKQLCQEILKKQVDNALVWKLLATNACSLKQWQEAINAIQKAIALGDNELSTFQFLANCYLESQQYLQAVKLLNELFAQTKENGLLVDLALNLHRMGEAKQALKIYENLLQVAPQDAKLRLNATILKLTEQPYGEAWKSYGYRHFMENSSRMPEVVAPIWRGETLQGKHILVWQEQGIADQIIFTRTFTLLAQDAAKVTVIGSPRLSALLKHSFPEIQFREFDFQNKDYNALMQEQFDYQILAGDLPQYYLKDADAFTRSYRKLNVKSAQSKQLQSQLNNGIKIGISWFGGSAEPDSQNRWSLPLDALACILKTPAEFYCLQYGNYKTQLKSLKKQNLLIHDLKGYEAAGSFTEYAALIENMDIIIAVDNSAAILAAALAKEVWILHPADPFWVWGVGTETPWYENTKHFIKPWDMDWKSYIEQHLLTALQQRLQA